MTIERWRHKADAAAIAWQSRLSAVPSLDAIVGVLCAAQHETSCGDAWAGEYNWGACTLRSLNAEESAALNTANVHPTVGHGAHDAAATAMAIIAKTGLPIPSADILGVHVPRGVIHCDSRPTSGGQVPYFVWFAAFDDDVGGAEYMIAVLCGEHGQKPARGVLDLGIGLRALAAAMYRQGYYRGFSTDAQTNIDQYANALLAIEPSVRDALGAHPRPTLRRGSRDPAVRMWQSAIGAPIDGIFGIGTDARTRLWQAAHLLLPDGVVGAKSWGVAEKLGFAVPSVLDYWRAPPAS